MRRSYRQQRKAMEASPFASTIDGPRRKPYRFFRMISAIASLLLGLTGLKRRGTRNAQDIRKVEFELDFDDLPAAFDGFTLLHLSDLHVGNPEGALERAASLLQGQKVDLAVISGDIQTFGRPTAAEAAKMLAPLLSAFTSANGTIAVLGNHDSCDLIEEMENLGVPVLVNESRELHRGGEHIRIVGTDDVHFFFSENALSALKASDPGFSIVVIHSPELAPFAAENGHDLYLTGHTHGGQIALPGGIPILTAMRRHRNLSTGLWSLGQMRGYTSNGLGAGPPAVRFNCRGEVALITLRCRNP